MSEKIEAGAKAPLLNPKWANLLGRFLALIIVFAFFALLVQDGKFYTLRNLENILRQSCVYATAGLGMTMVIIGAGIDLSAGSLIALSVVSVATVLNLNLTGADGQPHPFTELHPALAPIVAVLAGTLASTLAGLFNGLTIVSLRLMPFIVTLGTMGMIRGLSKGIAHERDIYPPNETWINNIMDPTLSSLHRPWWILPIGVWILIGGVLVEIGTAHFCGRLERRNGAAVRRASWSDKIIHLHSVRIFLRRRGADAIFLHRRHRPADDGGDV